MSDFDLSSLNAPLSPMPPSDYMPQLFDLWKEGNITPAGVALSILRNVRPETEVQAHRRNVREDASRNSGIEPCHMCGTPYLKDRASTP